MCYGFAPLTLIQNIIRVIKKDQSFSWIRLIMNRKEQKGFEAKLGGDAVALKTAKDLSGVVFGKQGGKYATMPETTDGHVLIVGGAGSRAEEAKQVFLEAAKRIPADQRQAVLERMEQYNSHEAGGMEVFKAEIEARRVLDSALKEQTQDRAVSYTPLTLPTIA